MQECYTLRIVIEMSVFVYVCIAALLREPHAPSRDHANATAISTILPPRC